MSKHCDVNIKLRHCLGAILIACALVGCAVEREWKSDPINDTAPWDKYECKENEFGKVKYPCIDPIPGMRQ